MSAGTYSPWRSPRHRWLRVAMALAAGAATLCTAGFVWGAYIALGGQAYGVPLLRPQPTNTAAASESARTSASRSQTANGAAQGLRLLALGDSLAVGFGDTSGRGFVGDVVQQLHQSGHQVQLRNLAVNGLTSAGLLSQLQQPATQSAVQTADVVLLSIGGNDLRSAATLPNLDPQRVEQALNPFAQRLHEVLAQLQTLNPHARVLLVGLYNPYADLAGSSAETNALLLQWNEREQQVASAFANVTVVPTFDLFAAQPAAYLYVDHFHPNSVGYQRIADRIVQDLQTVAPPAAGRG
ncbi:MAG: lysophospholipase [Alicyclobacillus sp.]|nr:lysophospholipase [Alicyclobacillus sp.]